jgi:hypothetical protein
MTSMRARHEDAPGHHVGHVAGDRVEATDAAGRGDVGGLRRPQLEAADVLAPRLVAPVGRVHQAGHTRHPVPGGGAPTGQVGLEEGRVHDRRPELGDQVGRLGQPAPPTGARLRQRVHRHPRPLERRSQALALDEVGDMEVDALGHEVGRQRGQRLLGAGRCQRVDDLEDALAHQVVTRPRCRAGGRPDA